MWTLVFYEDDEGKGGREMQSKLLLLLLQYTDFSHGHTPDIRRQAELALYDPRPKRALGGYFGTEVQTGKK